VARANHAVVGILTGLGSIVMCPLLSMPSRGWLVAGCPLESYVLDGINACGTASKTAAVELVKLKRMCGYVCHHAGGSVPPVSPLC